MPRGGTVAPFVGRTDEVRAIEDAVQRARLADHAGLVFVGEAGIGKSRLLAEAVVRLRSSAAVLAGSCLDLGDAVPYQPIRQALIAGIHDGASPSPWPA